MKNRVFSKKSVLDDLRAHTLDHPADARQGAVNMLNLLGIRIHAGAPELPVEQVLAMFLNNTIVYGDPSCHHHCEGHHH